MNTRLLVTLTRAKKRKPNYIFLILACGIFFLIAGELLTRLLIVGPSNRQYDAELSWSYTPNTKILHTVEGFSRSAIGPEGLADTSASTIPLVPRILLLGDSYAEGLEVPAAKRFSNRVTEALESEAVVINAGRRGLHPAQYPIIASRLENTYDPDAYLILLHTGDLAEIVRERDSITSTFDTQGKLARVRTRATDGDKLRTLLQPLLSRSAMASVLVERYKPIIMSSLASLRGLALQVTHVFSPEEGSASAQPSEPISPDAPKFSDEERLYFRQVLAAVIDELSESHPVYLAYMPGFETERPPLTEGPSSVLTRSEVESVAQETGVGYVNLFSTMQENWQQTQQPLHGFNNAKLFNGHLNAAGHQSVAAGISKAFGASFTSLQHVSKQSSIDSAMNTPAKTGAVISMPGKD